MIWLLLLDFRRIISIPSESYSTFCPQKVTKTPGPTLRITISLSKRTMLGQLGQYELSSDTPSL
ncbi:MAG: hypothetical protein M3Q79_04715, partial [bacterium]|nr:hypothetical protein [bacterium]